MTILNIIKGSIGLAVTALLFLSCTKEQPQLAPTIVGINSTSATVEVIDATVKSARNYIYVDGTAVSGATFSFGGVFPGTAYAFKVTPGSHTILIKDTLPTTTQVPLTFTQTLDAGKYYTIFTYDTITTIKQVTVVNNIVIPTDTSCMLRFANFVYNATAIPNVDVYSYRKGLAAPLFSNVPSATVTPFIPYASGLIDTLYVYATGTTSPLIAKSAVPSLTPTRSYTAVYNGSYLGTKTITTFATY